MKQIFKTTLTLVGSVVGAGFISGRELVRFFGGGAFLPVLFLLPLLLFGCFFLLLGAGRRYGSFGGLLQSLFGRWARAVRLLFLVGSFIVLAATAAGIDALAPSFAPWISLLTAAACFFIVKKGMNGVKLLHSVLVPCVAAYLIFSLFSEGRFNFAFSSENAGMDTLFCLLYVAMNFFLCAPVAVDLGGTLAGKGYAALCAGLAAVAVAFLAALILSAVAAADGAAERVMPLVYVIGRGRLFPLIVFFGSVTGFASAYYPLHKAAENCKKKDAVRLVLLAAASCLARCGLDRIVQTVYPALGVFGILFLTSVVLDGNFFQKHHQKIHHARQQAENDGRRHDEV